MSWYIVIVTSVDYYTMLNGIHKIKAESKNDAIEKVKALPQYVGYETSWNKYRFIEDIFNCGRREPKGD